MVIGKISLVKHVKWIYLGTFSFLWTLYIYMFWDVGQWETSTWAWNFKKYTKLWISPVSGKN